MGSYFNQRLGNGQLKSLQVVFDAKLCYVNRGSAVHVFLVRVIFAWGLNQLKMYAQTPLLLLFEDAAVRRGFA